MWQKGSQTLEVWLSFCVLTDRLGGELVCSSSVRATGVEELVDGADEVGR
jgi:hypothetical protein